MPYKFFGKKSAATRTKGFSGGVIESEIVSNQQLAAELHKPITKKFEKYCL